MWKHMLFAFFCGISQVPFCHAVVFAAEDLTGYTADSVLLGGNNRAWYPGEPFQWANQRILDSLIATEPDGFGFPVASPRVPGRTQWIKALKSPQGTTAFLVEADLRYISYDGGPNTSQSIVVGHNYFSHLYWFEEQLHFQSGRANWFKHTQRLYHSKETQEIEVRACSNGPKGAENAVIFSNDTASFFIMLTGDLEDATTLPEVYCLPHRSSHWQSLGKLNSGIQRIKGQIHGRSLKDYFLFNAEGNFLVVRKSDLFWTEVPSVLSQLKAKTDNAYLGKTANCWFAWKGNTVEFHGSNGHYSEDISKLVEGANWSPLIIPHSNESALLTLEGKSSLWAIILGLIAGGAVLAFWNLRSKRQRIQLPPLTSDIATPVSPLLLALLESSNKQLSSEELDVFIGLSDILSPETRRSRRARIIQLVNTESTARFGRALLERTKLDSDKRIVIYHIQDLSADQ